MALTPCFFSKKTLCFKSKTIPKRRSEIKKGLSFFLVFLSISRGFKNTPRQIERKTEAQTRKNNPLNHALRSGFKNLKEDSKKEKK